MIKIFDKEQVRKIDRDTIEKENISSIDLTERAALAMFEKIKDEINISQPVYIIAGPGNNGGDALAIARMLLTAGIKPEVFIVNSGNKLSPDTQINKEKLERLINIYTICQNSDIPTISPNSLIIDGLFGSGLNRPLEGVFADIVQTINNARGTVYSIDIPSGMYMGNNSDNNPETIIKADKAFSFQFPKLALLLPESSNYCKEMYILDIGLSRASIDSEQTSYTFTEKQDVSVLLKPRNRFSHKGDFGKVFLIAGSKGKIGAAVLASQGCMRAGAGLLIVHTPLCGLDVLQTAVPEAMVDADQYNDYSTYIDFDKIVNFTIGIGCGIGQTKETKKLLERLLEVHRMPMVLDADALNIISADSDMKSLIPQDSILTPHPVEFDRLIGKRCNNGYERLEYARAFAAKYNVNIVLKGAYTAVVSSDKRVFFNSTGNPGMATAGSGDSLTGIVTSLLAQKYPSLQAAILGVYLHGMAGDIAAKVKSQPSMLASDIINYLGQAYKTLQRKEK